MSSTPLLPVRALRRAIPAALAVSALGAVPAAPAIASPAGGHAAHRAADRDRDGLTDRFERRSSRTNPRKADTDRDGLTDGYEVRVSKTNPRKADTDRDGLTDGYEIRVSKTNPRKADTDRDGLSDGSEVKAGTNPLDPKSPSTTPPGGGGTPPGGGGGTPPGGGGTPPTGGGTPPTGGGTPPTGGGTPPDTTDPQTAIVTGTSGTQAATSATFTFSADEPATFECRIDGGAYSACTSPKTYTDLADGPHTFDVRAKDTAGNVDDTPASGSWTVDATAPVTSITSAPSGTVATSGATIEFTADEQGSTFQCRLDGGAWTTCISPVTLSGLGLGSHTFQVRATDAVGNTDATPAEATWAIAQTVPDTTITGGPSGTVQEFSATFTFSSPDPFATFECSLNDSAWEACSSPLFYPDLLPGDQTFAVRAKSALGVVDPTPAIRAWFIEDGGGGIS